MRNQNPLSWAVHNDRLDVVIFLLELAKETEEDGQWKLINAQLNDPNEDLDCFCLALRLGRITIIEHFMKLTGCGLDYFKLEATEQETGQIKPRYYMGLTINGHKKKDWAKAANPDTQQYYKAVHKFLHLAAYLANLDSGRFRYLVFQ